jgi:hypothetical protein
VNQEYRSERQFGEFFAAETFFEVLTKHLKSAASSFMEFSKVEALLHRDGMQLLKLMLQGFLDCCAREEQRQEKVLGSDGVERRYVKKECPRMLMTLFGEVTIQRLGYYARKKQVTTKTVPENTDPSMHKSRSDQDHSLSNSQLHSLYPLDGRLNLPETKYSYGLAERLCEAVVHQSFEGALSTLENTTGGKIPKRQAEEMAIEVSQDFNTFYAKGGTKESGVQDILCLTTDGKGIVVKENGLREATRKAAQKEKHKLQTRLCRGEKRNRKRMATVGAVYSVARHVRTAESIMSCAPAVEDSKPPKARNKRVWASLERDARTVIEEIFQEGLSRDSQKQREWVILVDGQEHQLNLIHKSILQHEVKPTIVLDFIHVLEYLWKAAYCFHSEGSQEAEQWVKEQALRVLEGRSSHAAAGMRRSATRKDLSPRDRKAVDKCAAYFLNNKDLMHYGHYLAKGYPIATGVIEGACRHLIKDRMDITGARWSLKGAEAILKLRSLRSSGDFDEYWSYYVSRSFERNHASCYNDDEWLQVA